MLLNWNLAKYYFQLSKLNKEFADFRFRILYKNPQNPH